MAGSRYQHLDVLEGAKHRNVRRKFEFEARRPASSNVNNGISSRVMLGRALCFVAWYICCTSFGHQSISPLRCVGMGGKGSGAKKGQKRRTKKQIAADNRRDRAKAQAKRAANVSFWSSCAGGQPAARPVAATVVVDDNHVDALAVAAADDTNDAAAPNQADGGDAAPGNEQPGDAAVAPAPPADPPGPPIPLYEVGDSIIYFGDVVNVQGTICAVDGGVDAGDLPMYDIQPDEGDSFPASWKDVAKEPADFGTRLRYRVGAGNPNWKELVMDGVRKEHEELVKAVVAARGDDEDDDDGDGDGNADADAVAENAEGTPDDPLPGVNLSGIPVMFRADIASEAARVRKWCKGSSGGNQHSAGPSIASWPYPAFHVIWKDPMLMADPKMKDFLRGTFGRCQFFLPSYTEKHQLDDGKMPCKWHGKGVDCVGSDCVFNPQGPRLRHDEDGGISYLFSSRHVCKTRRQENKSRGAGSAKIPHYFTGEKLLFDW